MHGPVAGIQMPALIRCAGLQCNLNGFRAKDSIHGNMGHSPAASGIIPVRIQPGLCHQPAFHAGTALIAVRKIRFRKPGKQVALDGIQLLWRKIPGKLPLQPQGIAVL